MSGQGGWGGWTSLGGWGGWSTLGGWGGWSSGPDLGPALSDGFANPLTTAALIASREGIVNPLDRRATPVDSPDPQSAENLERWEPWVRAAVAQQDLLSGVHVSSPKAGTVLLRAVDIDPATGNSKGQQVCATLIAPSEKAFQQQLTLVLSWAELREERNAEILAQIANQTPFLASVLYLHPTRTPRTLELLAVLMQLCVHVEMRFKHELACWRPVEYSTQVQPMITTPGHGSLPSGHATQAFAAAHVLQRLCGIPRETTSGELHPAYLQLQRQAARIATNRVIAGVHFPVDNIAGRLLGVSIAEYFCARCAPSEKQGVPVPEQVPHRTFIGTDSTLTAAPVEFQPMKQLLEGPAARGAAVPPFYDNAPGTWSLACSATLHHMWKKAHEEWARRSGVGADPRTP